MSGKPKISSTSDKLNINLYTGSLSFWHEKLVICRTSSVSVIYNKSHCLDGSPGSISLYSDLGLHSDTLCGYASQLSISLIYFFPRNCRLSLSDAIKCLSFRLLAAFSVLLDPIADTLAHHLAADFSCPCVHERIVWQV